jgi:hypothetical protein
VNVSGKTSEARAAERRPTTAASTMRTDGGEPVDVVVLDISHSGIRIFTGADLSIGQEISIGLAGAGVTRAYVAWRRDDQYGCVFERPITAEDTAIAFSNAPVARLGRAHDGPQTGDQDFLHDLYRKHRVWAVPPDVILMTLALAAVVWAAVRSQS